jgi:hypothetical protein
MNEARLTFIVDVINMFRLQGVCDSIKSPLAPLFQKGGNAHTPAFLITASGVLIHLQAVMSSPFDKRLDMSSSNVGDRGI